MKKHTWLFILSGLLAMGFWIPEQHVIPVKGASPADWNPRSFWYYPWGVSGTHKGIDIFAKRHQPVLAASSGLVLASGQDAIGGERVLILSAKWRFHYYAHLETRVAEPYQWVQAGQLIGTVGDSGNAKGKQPHLHYAIRRLFPQPADWDNSVPQGWRKMFYIDPHQFLVGQ